MPLETDATPIWLAARRRYEPLPDRGRFVEKSLLSVLESLAAFRERPGHGLRREGLNPALKLIALLAVVLMASLARSVLFLEAVGALELGCLCLLPPRDIARTLRKALAAAAFALVILLPSFLWGRGAWTLVLCAKVLLAVLAAALFSAATSWPSVAAAFASLRAPDLFVMTLDMTVKYITLLGGLLLDMLCALKLRSVGRDERKGDSLAAIAGTVFLKSREAAEEQYAAMECRGFTGTYRVSRRSGFRFPDAALAALLAALTAGFFSFGLGQ
jgi:cobalt/nickel transport system permease protein